MSADMKRKIIELRHRLGVNQAQLAEMIGGVAQATVSKWEKGKQKPNVERMMRLAALAGESLGQWLEVAGDIDADAHARICRVVGEIVPGTWRASIEWDKDEQYNVAVPPAPGVPLTVLRGYVVRGPSMNRLYPDGAYVFVAPLVNGMEPKNGQRVLARCHDGNGLFEAMVREYQVKGDGSKWLWPRSYDPEHQVPVVVGKDITITGVVMASFINEALLTVT